MSQIETTFKDDIKWVGEKAFVYKLLNEETKEFYYGSKDMKNQSWSDFVETSNYVTSSTNIELKIAISRGKVKREIIKFDGIQECKNFEQEKIKENIDNPLCLNKSTFTGAKLNTSSDVIKAKQIADEIIKNHAYGGVKAQKHTLNKTLKGELDPSDPLYQMAHTQVRNVKEVAEHTRNLATLIDDHNGDIDRVKKETGQNLLVVTLKDREWKGIKQRVNIGGKHTFEGTLKSKNGFTINLLDISADVHKDWSDDFVKDIALGLNQRSKLKILETHLDDIVKRIVDKVNMGIDIDSSQIKDLKNTNNLSSVEKRKVTAAAKKILEDQEHERTKPKNFMDYKTRSGQKILDDLKKEYEKDKFTIVRKFSSGKAELGAYITKVIDAVYHNAKNVKRIVMIVYHPSIPIKNKYEKEYKRGWESMKKFIESHPMGIKFDIVIMPTERQE